MRIYALKICDEMRNEVFRDLNEKKIARYGWSYSEKSNLIELEKKVIAGLLNTLPDDEKDCWKANFLLRIKPGDCIVYINTPVYGECTLAMVQEEYQWLKLGDDFNHTLKIDEKTIRVFNRNDLMIPSALQRRFKLQGKYWEIYLIDEFKKLLDNLEENLLKGDRATVDTRYNHLLEGIEESLCKISDEIAKHNAEKTLEELLKKVFEEIPNVQKVEHFQSQADKGADLIVTYSNGLEFLGIRRNEKCAVQVKSYNGTINDDGAINDIRRAAEIYKGDINSGLIVTTATSVSDRFKEKLVRLQEELGIPVGLIYGAELAKWFIKYGVELKID